MKPQRVTGSGVPSDPQIQTDSGVVLVGPKDPPKNNGTIPSSNPKGVPVKRSTPDSDLSQKTSAPKNPGGGTVDTSPRPIRVGIPGIPGKGNIANGG